jgi:hypothetical protein
VTGRPLSWLADPELVLKFIAHHLWASDQKGIDPAHEMPDDVIEDPWKERFSRFGRQTRQDHLLAAPQLVSPASVEMHRCPFGHPGIK